MNWWMAGSGALTGAAGAGHYGFMIDLLLRNARVAGQDTVTDIAVDQGRRSPRPPADEARGRSSTWAAGWSLRRWSSRTSTSTRC